MTTSPSHNTYKYKDQAKLNALTDLVVQYIDKIYSYFNVDISYKNDILIKSPCFIHGGDNPTALNHYYNADIRVHYKCRTHQCEEIFGSSLISLIRGGLSRTRYKWKVKGDKEASFNETVEFLLDITKQDFGKIDSNENSLDVEKANLVFAHFDVPHRPYTFDENCKFDGGRQASGGEKKLYNMTEEEKIIQHNLERNCVVYYLDIFLDNLRKQDYWEDLEIIIMSDHGSRITFDRNPQKEPLFNLSEFIEESFLSAIFAIKTKKIPSGSYDDKVTTNHLFFKYNN